jgi:hypothetical protein
VFKEEPPSAKDLINVPNAQQPAFNNKKEDKDKYNEWSSKVCKGVTNIMTGRRGKVMTIEQKQDLCACLDLLESHQSLMFSWDISLYVKPPALNPPRTPTAQIGSLPGDLKYEDPDDDYDDDDYDAVARPDWNLGEVRIVKQITTPFWYMARSILTCFLM